MSGQLTEAIDAAVDHVLGPPGGRVLLEYGDYECPFSAAAYRAIGRVHDEVDFQFVFRHFPLIEIHPHALAAAATAEAAALQDQFWPMHDWLFRNQRTLADDDMRAAATELGLDVAGFDRDRASDPVRERIRRDVVSGLASGEVQGTPTLFLDGVVHRGGYDVRSLLAALTS